MSLLEYQVTLKVSKVPKNTEFRILAKPHGHTSIYSIFDQVIKNENEEIIKFAISPSRCGGMDCPILVLLTNKNKHKGKLTTSMRAFTFWDKNAYLTIPKPPKQNSKKKKNRNRKQNSTQCKRNF